MVSRTRTACATTSGPKKRQKDSQERAKEWEEKRTDTVAGEDGNFVAGHWSARLEEFAKRLYFFVDILRVAMGRKRGVLLPDD